MAPKQKPNQAQIQADLKDEQILQSVLLADPFGAQHSWGPLSRQANDEDEEEDGNHKTGEGLPWVRRFSDFSINGKPPNVSLIG
jgi:hypothetical protein